MQEETGVRSGTNASELAARDSVWLRSIVFGAVYYAAAAIGGLLSSDETTYVSFWLPSGVYVSGLLLHSRKLWPWLVLGAASGNIGFDLVRGTRIDVILLFVVANTLQGVLGAWLVQRFVATKPTMSSLRDFFGAIGLAAFVSTIPAAAWGAAVLRAYDFSPHFWDAFKHWWGSCGMAVAIVLPFALTWFDARGLQQIPLVLRRRPWEITGSFALLIAGTWYLLVHDQGLMGPHKFWLFPVLLWVSVRFGLHGATAATLLLSLLMALLTTRYHVGLTHEVLTSGSYVFTLQTFLGVATLVTLVPAIALGDRDRTVAKLKDSEERFRQLSAAAFEGICISENGRILDANDQALRMFRATRETFIGRPLLDFISPDTRELVAAAVKENREAVYEHQLLRTDGSVFHAEAQARVVRLDNRSLRMTALRDITERKRAEAELRASEAVLRQFVKHAPAAIAIMDNGMRYLQASDRWLSDYHLDGQEIVGRSHYEVFPDIPERWREIHRRVLGGAVERCDEDAFPRADGGLEWLQWEIRPWHRGDGTIAGLIFFTQVITERKRIEEARRTAEDNQRALEAQLRQAQKMEAVGTLAGGIAHDFNNILGAIMAHVELARLDNPDNAELCKNLDQVLEASRRAASLVQQILTFSRRQPQEQRSMQIGPVVREAMKLLRSTLPTTIEFKESIAPNLPNVLADATQLHQIVVNLGTNAGHAMKGTQGRLSVEIDRYRQGEVRTHVQLPPGEYVRLSVKDTGHGMTEEVAQRIFEPFFTTKSPGDGTGLGLSVVHGIVLEHGGGISVESGVGQGSTFHVFLPQATGVAAPAPEEVGDAPVGQGQRILLVDDEKALADATSKLLARHGYRTTVFNNSAEAWRAFAAAPAEFDLLITDLTMPNIAGPELAKLVRGVRADIPIILTTGSRNDLTNEAAHAFGIREIFVKPVDYPSLLRSIQRLLAER